MFDAPLTLREFVMNEPLPLATIFPEVFAFLQGRADAVVFGAQAVNVYARTPRMTEDVDILSTDADALAGALRRHLADTFHIAARVRKLAGSKGLRIYQVMKPENRHLVDVRPVPDLPPFRVMGRIQVVAPPELVAMKVESLARRGKEEKGISDKLDLARLLNALPELRTDGSVSAILRGRAPEVLDLWRFVASEHVKPSR
jgi:hypothetical protein